MLIPNPNAGPETAEDDPRLAPAKIGTAEVAIFHRIQAFATGPNAAEEQALFDALGTIGSLKAHTDSGQS